MVEQLGELIRRGAEALRDLIDPHGRLARRPSYAPVPIPVRTRTYPRRYR
ncbi:MAG TPA: hypothetical protein VFI42_18455 [Thermomicrobiaceae bacterium]|nr:hypothetical protein [Thermomicrobiaceae bacterium]